MGNYLSVEYQKKLVDSQVTKLIHDLEHYGYDREYKLNQADLAFYREISNKVKEMSEIEFIKFLENEKNWEGCTDTLTVKKILHAIFIIKEIDKLHKDFSGMEMKDEQNNHADLVAVLDNINKILAKAKDRHAAISGFTLGASEFSKNCAIVIHNNQAILAQLNDLADLKIHVVNVPNAEGMRFFRDNKTCAIDSKLEEGIRRTGYGIGAALCGFFAAVTFPTIIGTLRFGKGMVEMLNELRNSKTIAHHTKRGVGVPKEWITNIAIKDYLEAASNEVNKADKAIKNPLVTQGAEVIYVIAGLPNEEIEKRNGIYFYGNHSHLIYCHDLQSALYFLLKRTADGTYNDYGGFRLHHRWQKDEIEEARTAYQKEVAIPLQPVPAAAARK